jgi:hypothetical protein
LIAETTNSIGQLLPSGNEVLYPRAFTDFQADVIYKNDVSGVEQLVVFRQRPPSPGEWGLDPANTVVQVISEFLIAPVPQITETSIGQAKDQCLAFGRIQMGAAATFAFGAE